jgi:hypothetical protein
MKLWQEYMNDSSEGLGVVRLVFLIECFIDLVGDPFASKEKYSLEVLRKVGQWAWNVKISRFALSGFWGCYNWQNAGCACTAIS